ncbi:MAG: RagB/SusD family nutrient uptake outer membrane protein [Bacteroidetes bacterium]|nr:RagB/SusD family nutrient uptake outer membrane protein [Bacteroidota bacterium]
MKRYFIFLSIVTIFAATACDVLDVQPTQSIPAQEAIKDRTGLERALTGSYDALQSAGYYGREYLVVPDLVADNLVWTGTTAGYNQIDNNSILSDNGIVESIWASIYTALNMVNHVIDAIPGLTDLTPDQQRQYNAEAHFLRALHHFNLVRMFGGVPVRTKPVQARESDLNVPRNSVNEVYNQVFADLVVARQANPVGNSSPRASRGAAMALSARAYLTYYSITGNAAHLDSAAFYAGKVINDFGYELEPVFANLFKGTPNKETIFYVDFIAQDRNRLAEYFFTRTLSGRKEFSPSAGLIAAYGNNDTLRLKATLAIASDGPYGLKYSDIANGSDKVPVFRLAEMHLIMAETIALKGGDAAQVRNHINILRNRAGVPPVTTADPAALLLAIENERRLEFAFEGHRWFDLVRTNRVQAIIPGLPDCYKLFPIPLSEIQANEAIQTTDQNPCY